MTAGRVPDLVAAIVSLGGQVEAVVPEQQSLEERFLELLGEHEPVSPEAAMNAGADHRVADRAGGRAAPARGRVRC